MVLIENGVKLFETDHEVKHWEVAVYLCEREKCVKDNKVVVDES